MGETTRIIPDGNGGGLRITGAEAHYFAKRMAHRLGLGARSVGDWTLGGSSERADLIDAAVDRYIEAAERQAAQRQAVSIGV